jgi:WD40 repeat protein
VRTVSMRSAAEGHAAPITHVDLRSDGRRLSTSSYDGTVIVWDSTDPARLRKIVRLFHRRLVNSSAWNPSHPDLLATASADKTVVVWRLGAGDSASVVSTLARHTDDINSVAWMPDGRRLICVSEDGKATMWDAFTGRFIDSVASHAAHCMMVSVSGAGLVATVGEDGLVAVSDPDSDSAGVTRNYDSSVEGCAWSHAGTMLAIARDDGYVDVLTDTLDLVVSMPISSSAARTVAWSADDSALVVGAYDGAFHFVGVDGTPLGRFDDGRAWPRSVSAVGDVVALGSFWSTPHLLDFSGITELSAPTEATHGPNAMVFDGEKLLIGCDSGTVFAVGLGDPDSPVITGEVTAHRLAASPILSLDVIGGQVYAGTYGGRIVRHDNGIARSERFGAPLPSLLARGDRLVSGTYNGEHLVVDARSLDLVGRQRPHQGSIKSMAALDARDFVSCATDRTVTAGSETVRNVLWEHGNLVNSVATLGGVVVASASRDHTVKVGRVHRDGDRGWVAESVQTLLGPDESVKCVGLVGTAEAPTVLAGSYDFGLYAWQIDWRDGAPVLRSGSLLAEFGQGVSCICRISDRSVAVAGWDGRILVVEQPEGGAVRLVKDFRVAELSARSGAEAVAPV